MYNPTSQPIKLRDLGIEISPSDTVDVRKAVPHMTEEQWEYCLTEGKLKDYLRTGKIIMSYENRRFLPEISFEDQAAKPFFRRGLTVIPRKTMQSDFIEKIQAEFSGESILTTPESKISKNTSAMINSMDFDGFDDPLKED